MSLLNIPFLVLYDLGSYISTTGLGGNDDCSDEPRQGQMRKAETPSRFQEKSEVEKIDIIGTSKHPDSAFR
jgi:hypothetical protein